MARYRIIRDCHHPLEPGGPHRLFQAGEVVETAKGFKPPPHFERLGPDKAAGR